MIILGIHGGFTIHQHDAAASLMINGKLICSVEEERLFRQKDALGLLPINAIKKCLKEIIVHKADVLEGDVMYFSPMIIHGGGSNSNTDDTRFSLEVRLEVA